jgi:Kef-type K+ transport system membrane component KefB
MGFAAESLGHDTKTSVFLGAALTATSVGITAWCSATSARQSTVEADRFGAAVADDVLGLVILTVVTPRRHG